MVLQVSTYLAYLPCCRERSTSPTRGDVSTNALAGYTQGIKLDKSKEGAPGTSSERCALAYMLKPIVGTKCRPCITSHWQAPHV